MLTESMGTGCKFNMPGDGNDVGLVSHRGALSFLGPGEKSFNTFNFPSDKRRPSGMLWSHRGHQEVGPDGH